MFTSRMFVLPEPLGYGIHKVKIANIRVDKTSYSIRFEDDKNNFYKATKYFVDKVQFPKPEMNPTDQLLEEQERCLKLINRIMSLALKARGIDTIPDFTVDTQLEFADRCLAEIGDYKDLELYIKLNYNLKKTSIELWSSSFNNFVDAIELAKGNSTLVYSKYELENFAPIITDDIPF